MGYFDGQASALFKRDESGGTVFYPWGVLGKGRLLPDEEAEKRVFRFVKLYFQISLVLVIGLGFFHWWYPAALLPILWIWYYLQCKALVSTYLVSQSSSRSSKQIQALLPVLASPCCRHCSEAQRRLSRLLYG